MILGPGLGDYLPLPKKRSRQFINCGSAEVPKLCPEYEEQKPESVGIDEEDLLTLETRLACIEQSMQSTPYLQSGFRPESSSICNLSRHPATLTGLSQGDVNLLEYCP